MNELVSVIMSTFNEETNVLSASIESILNQTYQNFEFIIINDNPNNENIKKILIEFSENKKIRVIYNEKNIGLAHSLNKAIKEARGTYILRMDADDISFLNRIEKEVKYLNNNGLDMVATNRMDINEEGNNLPEKSKLPKTKYVSKILPIGNFITHPTVLVKTEVLKELKGYRNFQSSQDYDLWLRILSSGFKIGILDEPLLYYRIRQDSISKSDKLKQYLYNKYQKELFRQRLLKGFDDFSEENLNKYLNKYNYFVDTNKIKFKLAYQRYEEGIMKFKRKQYISGLLNLIFSFKHKEVTSCLIENIRYQLLRRKYN